MSADAARSDATAVVTPARAKLNLYLRVVGRRPDGFHMLDSVVAFAECGDVVSAAPADALSVTLDGPFAGALAAAGPAGDNLVLRAGRALAAVTGCTKGAHLRLTKTLPVASGIGGGSADAAATLQALCELWDVAPAPEALRALALSLGADVPVCLDGRPCHLSGIGETLAPLADLPAAPLLLVNPGVPLATGPVFRTRSGAFSSPLGRLPALADVAALAALVGTGGNDLEPPARALVPAIGSVLDALRAAPGCLAAAMSGSGATCFGLFASPAAAAFADGYLRAVQPNWWVQATRLASPRPAD